MKRYFSYPLWILLFTAAAISGCRAGEKRSPDSVGPASGFEITEADAQTVRNLEVLGRVWGFVKYHHPAFYGRDSRDKDADAALFSLLPQVARAGKEERNRLLTGWVSSLGEFRYAPEQYGKYEGAHFRMQTDVSWTGDSTELGQELSKLLSELKFAHREGYNKYVKPYSLALRNPSFKGENDYPDIAAPDTGYRLLALFRYWNIIEYFYPNTHLTDKEWDKVLPEYTARFIECGPEGYHAQLARLITELNDSHAMLYPSMMPSEAFVQINARFVEDKLVVVPSVASRIGNPIPADIPAWGDLRFGDEIVAVNGKRVDSIRKDVPRYVSCSNDAAERFRTCVYAFSSTAGEKYAVVRRRGEKQDTLYFPTLQDRNERIFVEFPQYESGEYDYLTVSERIGYIDAAKYSNSRSGKIMEALKDTEAIIIDLRRYPSDFMIFDLFGRYFVPEPVNHVIFTKPVFTLPGCYQEDRQMIGSHNPNYYKGLVIALVDYTTISQAEYTAMTVQALPHGMVVGSPTMGADGNISEIPLPGGYKTLISGLGVYYPDGSETQRCGVRIDYPVEPTLEGVRAGRDEVLEKAIKVAKSLVKD